MVKMQSKILQSFEQTDHPANINVVRVLNRKVLSESYISARPGPQTLEVNRDL